MIEIPEAFAHETISREGEPGRAWIATLPFLAEELLQHAGTAPGPAARGGQDLVSAPRQRVRAGRVTVLRSYRFAPLLFAADPETGIRRGLDLYCEAAGIDRDRARRWAQVRAVKAALWGRRHGDPDWLIRATDQLAEILLSG